MKDESEGYAALLEDVAQNADLYIANQDVNTQT